MDHLNAEPGCNDRSAVHPGIVDHLEEPVWKTAAAFFAQPDFDRAVLAYCCSMVAPNGFRWPANKIFAQKIRYITCYTLIGLAERFEQRKGPAPTLTLLQTMVPGSARQVSDLISGLRAGGYVTAQQNALDRREIRLSPTPSLVLEIGRSPLSFLRASSILKPQDLHRLLTEDVSLLCRMLARSLEAFQAKDVLFQPFETVVDFTGRDSGYLMLCAVMGSHFGRMTGEPFELNLSYDMLSQRFQVSRQHVGNVLAHAVKKGLFTVQSGRTTEVDSDLVREFTWWCAGQMAHFTTLAQAVCAPISRNRQILGCDLEIR